MNGGILCIGKGRLSGACFQNGESVIIVRRGGALYQKRLLENRQVIDDGIIGYDKDCYVFSFGKISMNSEVNYENKL